MKTQNCKLNLLCNGETMFEIGKYYGNIKNYEEMKKYYLMAVNMGNIDAKTNLTSYYKDNISQRNNYSIYVASLTKNPEDESYYIDILMTQMYTINKKLIYNSLQKYYECQKISGTLVMMADTNTNTELIFYNYDLIMTFLKITTCKNIDKYIGLDIIGMLFESYSCN